MIAAGVIGAVILGFAQDKTIDSNLSAYDAANATALHSTYATDEKTSIFGDYRSINSAKLAEANLEEQSAIQLIQETAKKEALQTVAIFPVIMLVGFLLLMFYYKSKGGYKVVALQEKHEEEAEAVVAR